MGVVKVGAVEARCRPLRLRGLSRRNQSLVRHRGGDGGNLSLERAHRVLKGRLHDHAVAIGQDDPPQFWEFQRLRLQEDRLGVQDGIAHRITSILPRCTSDPAWSHRVNC